MLLSLWSTYWRGPQPQGVTLAGVVTGEAAGPSITVTLQGGGSQTLQLFAVQPAQLVPAPPLQPGAVALSFSSVLPIGVQPSPALLTGPVTLALSGALSEEAPGSLTASLSGGAQTLQLVGVLTGEQSPPVGLTGSITLSLFGSLRTGREGVGPSVQSGTAALQLLGVPRQGREGLGPSAQPGPVAILLPGLPQSGPVGPGPTIGTTVSVPTERIDISITVTVAPTDAAVWPYGASGVADATLIAAAETLATWAAALAVSNTLLAQAAIYSEGLQMADEIVRGNSVTVKATFKDALGAIVTPSAASVFISFPSSSGQRSTVELPLVNNAGEWSATWDSSNARVGEVFWSAQTKNTTPSAAVDGSFMLVANMANPENLA